MAAVSHLESQKIATSPQPFGWLLQNFVQWCILIL